jgi:hypothetical protein
MNDDRSDQDGARLRSVVISKEGAAIRVERIELTPAQRRGLTVGVNGLGPWNGNRRAGRKAS